MFKRKIIFQHLEICLAEGLFNNHIVNQTCEQRSLKCLANGFLLKIHDVSSLAQYEKLLSLDKLIVILLLLDKGIPLNLFMRKLYLGHDFQFPKGNDFS